MKKPYVYKRPDGDLYKVPVRHWNKHYGKRGGYKKCFIYVGVKGITIEHRLCLSFKVIIALLLPLLYPILAIQSGYKDANDEVSRVFFEERLGSFSSDYVSAGTEGYDDVIEFLRDYGYEI